MERQDSSIPSLDTFHQSQIVSEGFCISSSMTTPSAHTSLPNTSQSVHSACGASEYSAKIVAGTCSSSFPTGSASVKSTVTADSQPSSSSFASQLPQSKSTSQHPFSSSLMHLTTDELTNSQRATKETAVHEEVILRDMVQGCSDDRDGNYFDEYGGGVSVQQNVTNNKEIIDEPTLEQIISLNDFIGDDNDNTPYVPSQETSDDEGDVEPSYVPVNDTSDNEITEIPEQFRVQPREKKGCYRKTMPNYLKLTQLQVEMVNSIPWEVDGDHHYRIQCDSDTWVDRQKDSRWYVMTRSSRKGLRGIRKVGSCQGSRICQNIQCPKLQSEGVCNVNPKEFTPDHGAYICKCCGYYAVQIFCGCRKITEYNSVTKELDVWYEGVHNCIPKPDAMNKRNFFELLPLH